MPSLTATLVILLLLASPAMGQSAPPANVDISTIPAGELLGIFGSHVQDKDGNDAGRLWDILIDRAGKPRVAVIDYGGVLGVGRRKVAVAWQDLQFVPTDKAHPVHLSLTREQLGSIPEFKYDGGPTAFGDGQ